VKISVSLTEDDIAVLDEYARTSGLDNRSAVIRRALQLLRRADLGEDYAAAWQEWEASGEQAAWEGTAADGLGDAPR
jgi:Arc/MetJ-type ribon-helix-helix transcriptional regulator